MAPFMDKSIFNTYCSLLPEQESTTDFLQGLFHSPKTSRNCLWWSYVLIKTQGYSLLPRTLLNSVIDYFMRVF